MIPIHDLLHRIQWDPRFGKDDFVIGYHDRISGRIVRVPLRRVHLKKGERFSFEAIEDDGTVHRVPLHRVREVWRNGELIWHRKAAA
ncbi:MAG: DUF504 domain-containing protein [Burkholderiales bacterium]